MSKSNDKSPAAFGGVKGAMTSGDLVVPKKGPQKVVKKYGKAAKKKTKKS